MFSRCATGWVANKVSLPPITELNEFDDLRGGRPRVLPLAEHPLENGVDSRPLVSAVVFDELGEKDNQAKMREFWVHTDEGLGMAEGR